MTLASGDVLPDRMLLLVVTRVMLACDGCCSSTVAPRTEHPPTASLLSSSAPHPFVSSSHLVSPFKLIVLKVLSLFNAFSQLINLPLFKVN